MILTALQTLLLFASSCVATDRSDSSRTTLKERAAALRNKHFSQLNQKAPVSDPISDLGGRSLIPSESGVSYHWAGAVVPPPSGENITSVTATLTLPDLTAPKDVRTGPSGEYFLYVWVGIDGLDSVDPGDCTALWQTGFAGQIKDGITTWWGWVC